jgi:hypothetical protein
MTIHLPAILGFTRYQGVDPSPNGIRHIRVVAGPSHQLVPKSCGLKPVPHLRRSKEILAQHGRSPQVDSKDQTAGPQVESNSDRTSELFACHGFL